MGLYEYKLPYVFQKFTAKPQVWWHGEYGLARVRRDNKHVIKGKKEYRSEKRNNQIQESAFKHALYFFKALFHALPPFVRTSQTKPGALRAPG
jgi:hypothetical protein